MRTSLPSIIYRFYKKRKRDRLVGMPDAVKHLSKSRAAELLGWIGACMILLSYGLLSLGLISGNSVVYHSLMLMGSVGLAIITYRHKAFQSFFVNITFSFLAILALFRLLMLA